MTDTRVETEREPTMDRRSTDRAYERAAVVEDDAHPEVQTVRVRETRRSLLTTEFWLTLAAAVGLVIAGYWDEAELSVELAYALAAGIVAAYILSRGFAKSGSGTAVSRSVR